MSINNTILSARIKNRIIPFLSEDIKARHNVKNDYSFGFIVYFLMEKFSLSLNEALFCITDSSNDKGIDAIYINDNLGEVHIIQSEYLQNLKKIALGENKIRLTLSSVFDIMSGKITRFDVNNFLSPKIQNIIDLATDLPSGIKINIHFITNTQFPDNKIDNVEYKKATSQDKNYRIEWYELEKVMGMENESRQIFTTNIKVKEDEYNWLYIENIQGIVATISATELIKIYHEGGWDNVFESNIRNYLGSKPINTKIYDTAKNKTESKYFWFLNNGISLICDECNISQSIPSQKNIEIVNPQIINGGQTTKTLFKLKEDIESGFFQGDTLELFNKIKLLIRIYRTKNEELIKKITIGTNTQNAISKQDLEANNDISKLVQSYFEDHKYGLEIKKNEYNTGTKINLKQDLGYVATQDEVLQFYVSIYKEKPHNAYISKSKVFEDYFKLIFSEDNKGLAILPQEYLRAFEIGYFVQNRIKSEDISNGNSFLANCSIFLMFVMSQIEPKLKDITIDIGNLNLKSVYDNAKKITKELVEARIKKEDRLYSNNKYFKTEECKKDFLIFQDLKINPKNQ